MTETRLGFRVTAGLNASKESTKPSTLTCPPNPELKGLNPKPFTLSPELQTLNPKPNSQAMVSGQQPIRPGQIRRSASHGAGRAELGFVWVQALASRDFRFFFGARVLVGLVV